MQLWLPEVSDIPRFKQALAENAVPKWIDHYIDYGTLKKQVKTTAVRAPSFFNRSVIHLMFYFRSLVVGMTTVPRLNRCSVHQVAFPRQSR